MFDGRLDVKEDYINIVMKGLSLVSLMLISVLMVWMLTSIRDKHVHSYIALLS